MAMVSGSRSTLNPNAPLFIPAAFLQVEDFSPEWWNLVKTSTWFRDYWLGQHQENLEEEDEDEDDDDIVDLLPDSFDIGGMDGFSVLEPRMDEAALQVLQAEKSQAEKVELPGIEFDGKKIVESMNSMKSPKVEPARYPEKAPQCLNPKYSPRRIQQPR